jgi:hypothetical protein
MSSQNHFTLSFSLNSPEAGTLVAQQLPPLMPQMFKVEDHIGTYCFLPSITAIKFISKLA